MIPAYIINYDRLTTTRRMVEYLSRVPGVKPVVIDNDSSYPPLLEWYATGPCEVVQLGRNVGHLAPWSEKIVDRFGGQYYIVTDSDLIIDHIPRNFIGVLQRGLLQNRTIYKCGFGLEIKDLPDTGLARVARYWERSKWRNKRGPGYFFAPTDSTFALYSKERKAQHPSPSFFWAYRTDYPYVAKHAPWYITKETVSEEELYIMEHHAQTSDWNNFVRTEIGQIKVNPDNPYTQMQQAVYDIKAEEMGQGNHSHHNDNPDYWDILVSDTVKGMRNKIGLDFGCGTGRNIINLWDRFARFDGVDISAPLLNKARELLNEAGVPKERSKLIHCNGVDLSDIPDSSYDFIMSTIALQHIPVYDIRFSYLSEFFRVLKPGGLLSFQMGYGVVEMSSPYSENCWNAAGTNSVHDVRIEDPMQVEADLVMIGFEDFSFVLRPSFADRHPQWIFVKARKPR